MMHATPWRIAGADGGLECSNSEPCIDRAADGVTYDPTGPSIENRSQVHKAGRDCDIGDVGYPQLVRAIQFHVLREIGEDRIIVIAIRRRDKTPPLLWIQRMLAHEPADLLGVHDNAMMAQFGVNTPIAIGFKLVANRFHLRNGTRFRALGGQPCAPTPQSWLRIPGVDRQPGRLRPRRRLHTSEPRRESADARYHAAWKARTGSPRQ